MAVVLVTLELACFTSTALSADAMAVNSDPSTGPQEAVFVADALKAASMPDGDARDKAMASAMNAWAYQDPMAAYLWAAQTWHQNPAEKNLYFIAMDTAGGVWVSKDALGAANWAIDRDGMFRHFIFRWWGEYNPAAATAWVLAQPKEKRALVINTIVEGWTKHDVKAASEWVLTLPPEDERLAYEFPARRLDPTVVTAWVERITDPDARKGAIKAAALAWAQRHSNQIDKVKVWVNQVSIPDAERVEILQKLDKK
jgi:hypothetical protein